MMLPKYFQSLLCIFIFSQSLLSFAFTPIRDPNKLWSPATETMNRVRSAKVVLADYKLIRRDFIEVRDFSNAEIDAWLIRNTAFISKPQAEQTKVNTPISITDETRLAYRPREYGRGNVFVVDTGGLIDAKGTGALEPNYDSHANGLITLGESIREYLFEKLVHSIFLRDTRFDTVGTYAILDFGFDVIHMDDSRSRAGVVLRQAHVRYHGDPIGIRPASQPTMLPRKLQIAIERLLRSVGLTSAQTYGHVEYINLQGAEDGSVVDFGTFLAQQKFKKPVSYYYDKKGNEITKPEIAMLPKQQDFVQPNSKIQIPFQIWGHSESGVSDSTQDNPFIWSHAVAQAYADGRISRDGVEQHVRNMFDRDDIQTAIHNIQPSCSALF